jgi:arsenate reductase
MSKRKPFNVLFLCTGNSARSILSEAILNDVGFGRFLAFSAGSKPSGTPHPEGLAELQKRGHAANLYRSKSWDEFARADAPAMDIIVTVCGSAAGEVCPVWPSPDDRRPLTVHWGAEDPAYIEPLEARQAAFSQTYNLCRARIEALVALPDKDVLNREKLKAIADIQV